MLQLKLCVFCSGAVTAFARDAGHEARTVIAIGRWVRGEGPKVSGVALHAGWVDDTREVSSAIVITGAIDPSMAVTPVADWQFEKPIALPIEIGLASCS